MRDGKGENARGDEGAVVVGCVGGDGKPFLFYASLCKYDSYDFPYKVIWVRQQANLDRQNDS